MTRVGFLLNFPVDYKGGINYFNNLFKAIDMAGRSNVKVILFVPSNIGKEYYSIFNNVEIVPVKVLERNTLSWFIDKVFEKIFKSNPLTISLLKKHKIKILSHSNIVVKDKSIQNINWIPDFQYKHYPHLWNENQLAETNTLHNHLILNSEIVVLSSYDAFNDLKKHYPEAIHKARVLHFVSQPYFSLDSINLKVLEEKIIKYTDHSPYFYLPNQFWSHKNHSLVFEACKILNDKGYNFMLITSGFMKDYRNSEHINDLINYVQDNNLEKVIKFLGLIPYEDVFLLNLFSLALINPSYFEGWSSTVEEAKTIGTRVILSNINVHKEQSPPEALYFDPNKVEELVFQMEKILLAQVKTRKFDKLHNKLIDDTIRFGREYIEIIDELVC